jgi:acyl-CoA synthetase (NDP forming)
VLVHDFPYRSLPSEVATANEVTRQLLRATRDRPELLPVYVSLTSGEPPAETKLMLDSEGGGAPLLRGASEAFTAIASLARWLHRREARLATGPVRPAWSELVADRTAFALDPYARPETGRSRPMTEADSLERLRDAGFPVIQVRRAMTTAEAIAAAGELGYPVAVKIDAEGLGHKTELGGVRLDLADEASVRAAADELLALSLPPGSGSLGVLVQPMATSGVELIVGARRDPSFGPTVLVGLGGILAEVLDDVALRLAPVRAEDARSMLGELRGRAMLDGVRGMPGIAVERVVELLVRLGEFVVARADIVEIDLNPVIATPSGATIVDALIVTTDRP